MLILVVGCGSIGRRHIRNLKALKAGDIIAHDTSRDSLLQVEREYGVKVHDNVESALAQQPDIAFICTPTSRHIAPALVAAGSGCHLFIEKPLSHSLEGVSELVELVSQKGLITAVGHNMRFHPGIALMKELLDKKSIGGVLCARLQAGQYLPERHSWEDYRQGYAAREELGGGTILDGVHEIDYITWFLGEVSRVFCFGGKLSSLEIDTEDTAEILLQFKSGAIAEVHLDYVQRYRGRSCQLIGEEGTILWDFNEGEVRVYSAKDRRWQAFPQQPDYDLNEMYIEEVKHFLKCVKEKTSTMHNIKSAKKLLEIALAAKESMRTGESIGV